MGLETMDRAHYIREDLPLAACPLSSHAYHLSQGARMPRHSDSDYMTNHDTSILDLVESVRSEIHKVTTKINIAIGERPSHRVL